MRWFEFDRRLWRDNLDESFAANRMAILAVAAD
jgi:hypothetical protein